MKSSLYQFQKKKWHLASGSNTTPGDAQLVLCFGGKNALKEEKPYSALRNLFPYAEICLCSTAGEILQDTVSDESLVAVAIQFEKTTLRTKVLQVQKNASCEKLGEELVHALQGPNLQYVLVLSDGSEVNGSDLVRGMAKIPVLITGGLAGDGGRFESTLVGLNEDPKTGQVVAVGFYGSNLKVGHGSQGGWDMFGRTRTVTKSKSNILYEIDGENALELYKRYLGEASKELPSAALLYPLALEMPGSKDFLVRTILSIDEDTQSMIFAGDLPEGAQVRLMKANFEKLNEAAAAAAKNSISENLPVNSLALLISCVGRKLVLGALVEDEIDHVRDTLGNHVPVIGFYSYGEISPFNKGGGCQLHNQTMTITTLYETT